MPRQGLYVALIAAAVGVASAAQQNHSREFGPRACGPADPTQIRIASETGGQPFFLSPTELAASTHIMRETASADRELILWASASSEGRPLEFPIPVDSSIGRLTISASFDRQGGTLNIIAPDGRVNPRPEGSEETILNCAHVLTIATPLQGIWQAQVTGTGRAWVVASGRTDLGILSTQFVEQRGRPGHEGLFGIAGQPVVGRPATLRVRLDKKYPAKPVFTLISAEGQQIATVALAESGDAEFVGAVDLPREPFRVVASAVDGSGDSIQRVHAPVFRAERVELQAPSVPESLTAGTTTAIDVIVRNHGPAAQFHIVATNSGGPITRVGPRLLELAQGAEGTVRVWVNVPAGRGGVNLTVVATSTGTAATSNSFTRTFAVAQAR